MKVKKIWVFIWEPKNFISTVPDGTESAKITNIFAKPQKSKFFLVVMRRRDGIEILRNLRSKLW